MFGRCFSIAESLHIGFDNSTLNLFTKQVVTPEAGDFSPDKRAGRGVTVADYTYGVDFRRLAEETAFCDVIFINTIDDAGEGAADSGFVFFKGDLLLGQHKAAEALFFDMVGDLVREFCGGSALFGVEGEAAEVVEASPLDEFEEFIEACVGFAGEADDEGCSQDTVGQAGPEPLDESAEPVF